MKLFRLKKQISLVILIAVLCAIPVISQVVRQPYLQIPTSSGVFISWITGTGTVGEVYYGTDPDSLETCIQESQFEKIYHEVELTGLLPATRYYYTVDGTRIGLKDQYFITNPLAGQLQPVRIWVISDFGQTNSYQNDERIETVERWREFNDGSYHADFILSLGDQTEDDSRYQLQHNYFNPLESVLKNTPLFTLIGNHDNHDSLNNYLRTFALPIKGEAGGIPSGTEKYYSFNYSNVHIVVLCTEIDEPAEWDTQIKWLGDDLEANSQDWLIACMHRPFHSGGYHRTDIDDEEAQIRRNDWLPILEDHGIDLVLQGHNHVYERSFLLNGLLGKTSTLDEEHIIDKGLGNVDDGTAYRKKKGLPQQGTVFIEIPGGGVASKDFELYPIFPVHYNGYDYEGSVVVDVNGNRMDVRFICNESDNDGSHIWDYFTIIKE